MSVIASFERLTSFFGLLVPEGFSAATLLPVEIAKDTHENRKEKHAIKPRQHPIEEKQKHEERRHRHQYEIVRGDLRFERYEHAGKGDRDTDQKSAEPNAEPIATPERSLTIAATPNAQFSKSIPVKNTASRNAETPVRIAVLVMFSISSSTL